VQARKLQTILADLGDHTRDLYKEKKDIFSDPVITEIMEKLTKVEDECKRIEDEIQKLGFETKK
jgi:hypothetical protein